MNDKSSDLDERRATLNELTLNELDASKLIVKLMHFLKKKNLFPYITRDMSI